MAFNIDEYVDVAARITQFYERFPEGRLTRLGEPKLMEVGSKLFVLYTAKAYRTPDDPVPAIGTAWEPFPGPTQFTRDSELMNAETAAWGRAIIAAGIPSKKIASSDEVKARTSEPVPEKASDIPSDILVFIGDTEAGKIIARSDDVGIDRDLLRKAAWHKAGMPTSGFAEGLFADDAKAIGTLASFDDRRAGELVKWIEDKRVKMAEEAEGAKA
jgi:hypothetical protein